MELTNVKLEIMGFLKGKSLQNKWVSQKELQEHLQMVGYNLALRQVRQEITDLRKDTTIDYIIISNTTNGYKILSNEEEIMYLENKKEQALKKLKLYWNDVKRLSRNNQLVMQSIDENERKHIESILNC